MKSILLNWNASIVASLLLLCLWCTVDKNAAKSIHCKVIHRWCPYIICSHMFFFLPQNLWFFSFCFCCPLGKVELNEIESRCEEYPLTRAFCRLISTLVESSFPSNLGAGLRPPGFDPYLQFLRDAVFLRFRTRAYRRAAEKVTFIWKIFLF